MKPSANGRSSSVIVQGLASSMHALGHNSRRARSTKKGTEAVPRLALAARRAVLRNAGARPANVQHAGEPRSEQVWLVRLGHAPLRGCVATGGVRDLQAWPLVSDVLGPAVLSREEHCSEVQCRLHVVQGCRLSATCAATNRSPLPSRYCSGRPLRGKRTHSVEMPSEERQGRRLDGKRYNATKRRRDSSMTAKWQSPHAYRRHLPGYRVETQSIPLRVCLFMLALGDSLL